jgi:hypothetical protein
MPVFALFFPVPVAVAATALVHGANNLFKVALFARLASWPVVLRFGVPAVACAFDGAALLAVVSDLEPIARYAIGPREAEVTPVKLLVAVLMIGFAIFELLPRFRHLELDRRYRLAGGVLSGFFGGLSGHRGRFARRSSTSRVSRPRPSWRRTRSSASSSRSRASPSTALAGRSWPWPSAPDFSGSSRERDG